MVYAQLVGIIDYNNGCGCGSVNGDINTNVFFESYEIEMYV